MKRRIEPIVVALVGLFAWTSPVPAIAAETVVYLNDLCSNSNLRGIADAKRDIKQGRLHFIVYMGGVPMPPSRNEVEEAMGRVKVLKSLGIAAEARMGSDVPECVHDA